MDVSKLPELFGITGENSFQELSVGHINRTFLVTSGENRYILQSLNRSVFASPETVMENISHVEKAFEKVSNVRVPHFLTANGKNFAEVNGEIWRMYSYCDDSPCDERYYRTGFSYGTFIRVMSSSDAEIKPVIDGFHDFEHFYEKMLKVCPAEVIPAEIDALRKRLMHDFDGVPKRMIHGDAKADNIITGDICTIIDLDTVMTGYAALDYGDMIRSAKGGISELTRGFLDGCGDILTKAESDSLYSGVLWVTGELAMRYLTDFYSPERYFTGKTREQCLERSEELISQLREYLCK